MNVQEKKAGDRCRSKDDRDLFDDGRGWHKTRGASLMNIALTIVFFSAFGLFALQQFGGASDELEAQGASAELVGLITRAGIYYDSNDQSYLNIDLPHLGIGTDNMFGIALAITTVGTAAAFAFTYSGFPSNSLCVATSNSLRNLSYLNVATMYPAAGTAGCAATVLTVTMDDTR